MSGCMHVSTPFRLRSVTEKGTLNLIWLLVTFMKYYPRSQEEEERTNNVWMKGHGGAYTHLLRVYLYC